MTDKERLLERLYTEHERPVRALILRLAGPGMDVDDLHHEVFVIAWRKLDALREAPGRGWLCAIALKVVAGARRRARIRRFVGLDAAASLSGPDTPASEFEKAEASRLVYAALERLSEAKRTVFVLFELQGMTGEEIAVLLRCPLKTVWSRLSRARAEFESQLRRDGRGSAAVLQEGAP